MIIGIDLGTTNSLVGIWQDGEARLIPNSLGRRLTPSVVSISDGEVLVGATARERLSVRSADSAAAFKRHMGTSKKLSLCGTSYRPEELSAMVLKVLKADAEAYLGEPVTEAVITVPAYFNDTQRQATRTAAELAGLKVERLLNEPTAAALAYGLHESSEGKRFLIFDLGGGTFDVSILEYFEGVMEVHASAGDNFLGGEDFLDVLIDYALETAGVSGNAMSRNEFGILRNRAESAKLELTNSPSAIIAFTADGEDHEIEVTREQFEQLSTHLLERLFQPCQRALRDAELSVADIDEVVLVGGATRMTMIPRLVAKLFGRLPLRHFNPDEVVGMGAAVQAGLKARDAALRETVMTDVCPYSLGFESAYYDEEGHLISGLFQPIIERNMTIPLSRSHVCAPTDDFQPNVMLRVFQGESRMVADNIFLGELEIKLKPAPRAESQIEVRLTYDINGLLQVEAKLLSTGKVSELIIQQNPNRLSPAEVKECLARLEHLKIHPRELDENRVVLERANRLFEEHLGKTRQGIGDWIDRFQSLLETQDAHEIAAFRAEFIKLLDHLEHLPLN